MVSLLMAKAIDSLYPQRDKEIVSAYVINARPMLQAPKTLHNCLGMALFTYSDRVRAMPFTRQCTVYRGMTFVQSDEDRIKAATGANAGAIRAATAASPSIEEKKKVFGQMFQEIGGIDARRDETVGGEKFGSWEFREVGWGSVGEHRVVEKISAAGDDFRDM